MFEREGGSFSQSLAVSPDARHLLMSSWGKQIQTKLPDGRTQYTTEMEGIITLWDLESGNRLQLLKVEGGAGAVAFSSDGQQFAVATNRTKSQVTIFDIGGKKQQILEGIPNRIWSLGFNAAGNLIAGLDDTSALVYDLTMPNKK